MRGAGAGWDGPVFGKDARSERAGRGGRVFALMRESVSPPRRRRWAVGFSHLLSPLPLSLSPLLSLNAAVLDHGAHRQGGLRLCVKKLLHSAHLFFYTHFARPTPARPEVKKQALSHSHVASIHRKNGFGPPPPWARRRPADYHGSPVRLPATRPTRRASRRAHPLTIGLFFTAARGRVAPTPATRPVLACLSC